MREYDLIAEWYASERVGPTGVPEALALASSIPRGARVIDVGCGNGIPLTRTLLDAGHQVVGLDSSAEMLARFRRSCPEAPSVRGIAERCPFADGVFDAAVAWGVLFHLRQNDQRIAIADIARVLKSGAPFLFTAGDVDGSSDDFVGTMNGVEFHYYSFTVEGYRQVLAERGLTLIDFHQDSGQNGYYLARKSR